MYFRDQAGGSIIQKIVYESANGFWVEMLGGGTVCDNQMPRYQQNTALFASCGNRNNMMFDSSHDFCHSDAVIRWYIVACFASNMLHRCVN